SALRFVLLCVGDPVRRRTFQEHRHELFIRANRFNASCGYPVKAVHAPDFAADQQPDKRRMFRPPQQPIRKKMTKKWRWHLFHLLVKNYETFRTFLTTPIVVKCCTTLEIQLKIYTTGGIHPGEGAARPIPELPLPGIAFTRIRATNSPCATIMKPLPLPTSPASLAWA
ncbi:MAG TPA: hypothetical protein VFM34_10585, partial [Moraxellaceae bacterium]|nr:hypothetical protein [Moraxellaceae bacterium]